ncbi:MAG TPA: HAD-IC family P-type ATPase [Streptosporangiaceae bacterium]
MTVTNGAPPGLSGPVITGLTHAEVAERIAVGKVNAAPPEAGRSITQILRANLCTRFNAILGTLFVVVLIIGPLQDALFGPILVVNTGIGVYQELRAKRTLDNLAILTQAHARALRDGQLADVPVEEVVQDDVLELRLGDQVPVDAIVLDADGLELDEALLTGEAEPVAKNAADQVLSGSFVVAGSGRVRATGVGGEAYAARLQSQARRFSMIRSELQQGTSQILRMVTWVMIPAAVLLIISQFFRSNEGFLDSVRGAVAGVVGMVPEGLVLLTSLAFTMGAMRLARRRVLVQELAAIEGLARVDVLCVDKTGTLTKPGMRVMEAQVLGGWPDAQIADAIGALIASDSNHNATVAALSERFTGDPGWTERSVVTFSSARKWSGATFAGHGSWLLGAPSVLAAGVLDREASVSSDISGYEAQGRRVLLLAHSPLALDGDQLPGELSPAALLVLAEDLRDDTAETVRYLVDQGVTIKVMSGDAPGSVAAIAARAGIPPLGPPLDGYSLTEDQVGDALGESSVLGRVKPGQKLAGVKALQARGHVVAMVGDGVNDVQALKQADLGIAMGSGSQASRAVARVVLLDGTFSAVPLMLAEGRRVITNIERAAGLFVTKTVYAAIIAIVVGIAGIAYPFFPRHLTIISTFTVGVPGFFLALASQAPRAQPGFTRRVLAFAVPAGVAVGAAGLVSYMIARAASGIGAAVSTAGERTAAMLAVFAVAMWVLGLIARPLTASRIVLLAAMVAGLVLCFAIPLARRIFALQLPPGRVLAAEAAVSLAAIIVLTVWRARGDSRLQGALGSGGSGSGGSGSEGSGSGQRDG